MGSFLHNRFMVLLLAINLSGFVAVDTFAQKRKPYQENLSVWRPALTPSKVEAVTVEPGTAPIPASHTVNHVVDSVLDSLDSFNRSRLFIDGFTVQIYSGQKKQEALETNKLLVESGMDLKAEVEFIQPKFRVVVGRYYTRLAAHRDLFRLRRLFPNAIIVPEKVPVKQ